LAAYAGYMNTIRLHKSLQ